ncbi:MAG: hypothetical protein IJ588_00135 [Prevotella sp.]|nr:hypothetical protein [Prevotella sp.]
MKKNLLKSLFLGALMVLSATNAWAGDKAVVKYSFDDANSPALTAGTRATLDYTHTSVISKTPFLNIWGANNSNGATNISLGDTDLSGETWTLQFDWAGYSGCNGKTGHTYLKAGDTNLFDIVDAAGWGATFTLNYGESNSTALNVYPCNKDTRISAKTADVYNTANYWLHFTIVGSTDGVKLTIAPSNGGDAVLTDAVLSSTNVNPTTIAINPGSCGAVGIDELSLTYYVEGEVIQTPIAAYTKVDGISRTITATCDTEGVTIQHSTDGTTYEDGASVTVSESGKVYFKAVKGTSQSDVLEFDVVAGEAIILNAPVINRTSDTSVTISSDQSKLLLSPTATITYEYGTEKGSFTGEKTLTVAATDSIKAYAEAEGYTTSSTTKRAVALFPSLTFKQTENTATNKSTAGAFSTETITASERTYAAYIINEEQWGTNIYLQTEGWGIRTGGDWYVNTNDEAWMLFKGLKKGDLIVVNITVGATSMVNATYSEEYTYGRMYAYTVSEDGDVELGFKRASASENNYFYGITTYTPMTAEEIAVNNALIALNAQIAAAEALLNNEANTKERETLTAAIEAAKEKKTSTDATEINAATTALKAAADAFVIANAEFPYQKYLVQNIASKKYWSAGNSWGTQASLVEHAEYIKFNPLANGNYQLESQVNNGGTSYYFNGDYMDNGSPIELTIAKVSEGKYTIAAGTNYFGWDGTTTVLGKNLDANSENALWTIVPLDSAKAALANATAEAPMDATFLIEDHDFGRNNRYSSKWTLDASNKNISGGENNSGSIGNNCAESYHSAFTLKQVIENVPNGLYKMTAQGFYRQDGSDNENLPYFYINDSTKTFPLKTGSENSMTDASVSFSAGNYTIDSISVVVLNGTITLGAKNTNTSVWAIWDNFVLTYFGPVEIDITEYVAAYEKALAAANEKAAAKMNKDAKAALDAAIAANSEVDKTNADALIAATTALSNASSDAEVSIEAYKSAKAALDGMKNVIDGTNVYTQEAFETYNKIYTDKLAAYTEGTLADADAKAIENPEAVTGWRAANIVDNFLLSAWDTTADDFAGGYYINTWSTEGNNDGSEFKVPFFEYWTGDGDSLGEKTLTATMSNLEAGDYDVTAWVRVRIKNGAEAPAAGIILQANDGEAANASDGAQVGTSQFYLKEVAAKGTVAEDGVLKIKFIVAADNNISWLSFKNVKFEKSQPKFTVNEVVNDQIVRTTEGKAALGTTVKVPYRHYNVVDGKLYSKGVTNKEYNYSFTLNENNQVENITGYTATGTQDIVFLAEGEDIEGLTPCNSANTAIRSSNSASAYAAEADVEIVKLPAGTYKLTAAIYDSAKTPNSMWYFIAGTDTIAKLNCTNVNYQELSSDKFTLEAETSILLAKGGSNTQGLDLVYIQKVEAETPVYAYTVNEKVGDEILRTTTGTADKASVVKVAYRHYNVLDGKLYSKGVTNKEYNYSFTLNENNQVENIVYDATEIENVVFLKEGEDIEGLTKITTGNSAIRSSNSAAGYAAEADVEIVKLPAGIYKLTAALYDSAKTPDSHFIFKAGETQIADLNCTNVNYQELSSDEFTLTAETAILLAKGGSATQGLDLVYIVKVGDIDTGINTLKAEIENGSVYNLNGQKVQKAQKGLYIINGKKVVVK